MPDAYTFAPQLAQHKHEDDSAADGPYGPASQRCASQPGIVPIREWNLTDASKFIHIAKVKDFALELQRSWLIMCLSASTAWQISDFWLAAHKNCGKSHHNNTLNRLYDSNKCI